MYSDSLPQRRRSIFNLGNVPDRVENMVEQCGRDVVVIGDLKTRIVFLLFILIGTINKHILHIVLSPKLSFHCICSKRNLAHLAPYSFSSAQEADPVLS